MLKASAGIDTFNVNLVRGRERFIRHSLPITSDKKWSSRSFFYFLLSPQYAVSCNFVLCLPLESWNNDKIYPLQWENGQNNIGCHWLKAFVFLSSSIPATKLQEIILTSSCRHLTMKKIKTSDCTECNEIKHNDRTLRVLVYSLFFAAIVRLLF